jgi:thiosulfate reductase cytochrome b subunit
MKDQVYLYPIWVRLWHLVNALLFLALLVTGLSLQYSSTTFSIMSFTTAVSVHNIAGYILIANYILYLLGNRFTSNGLYYQFRLRKLPKRVFKQFIYYSVGIFKNESAPYPISKKRKFNPLQKLSYVFVMYLTMPFVIGTGIALLYPDILPDNIMGFSGIHFMDLIHILVGFILSIFIIVHVYFCTIGKTPLANFKSMINGWH